MEKGVNEEGELDVGMDDSESESPSASRCICTPTSGSTTDTKGNRLIKSWLEPKQRGIELVKSLLERHKEAAQRRFPAHQQCLVLNLCSLCTTCYWTLVEVPVYRALSGSPQSLSEGG